MNPALGIQFLAPTFLCFSPSDQPSLHPTSSLWSSLPIGLQPYKQTKWTKTPNELHFVCFKIASCLILNINISTECYFLASCKLQNTISLWHHYFTYHQWTITICWLEAVLAIGNLNGKICLSCLSFSSLNLRFFFTFSQSFSLIYFNVRPYAPCPESYMKQKCMYK